MEFPKMEMFTKGLDVEVVGIVLHFGYLLLIALVTYVSLPKEFKCVI
jgi:hypothetical protein